MSSEFSELAQWVRVNALTLRSINIERDAADARVLENFQITPMVLHLLSRLEDSLKGEGVQAWSLTGPYGTGKSSFCNFLLSLFSGEEKVRRRCFAKLHETDEALAGRLEKVLFSKASGAPVFAVRGVSQYEPLNRTLCRSLLSSLKQETTSPVKMRRIAKKTSALLEKEDIQTGEVVELFEELAEAKGERIFLVVDEVGKNLEYQAHNPARGDIFALQMLAESKKCHLWICLHQAFGIYAKALTKIQREEWQKIQGRFEDVSYIDSSCRSLSLIRNSLDCSSMPSHILSRVQEWAGSVKESLSPLPIHALASLSKDEIASLYPFHPLAALLLGELVRRFGQNDRTLFSFLSSGEAHAFPAWLHRTAAQHAEEAHLPMLGLCHLYDYFCQRESFSLVSRAENQRWIEIHAIISQFRESSEREKNLLKTVGILNLLSDVPGVGAFPELLHAALETEYYGKKGSLEGELQVLLGKNVLLYREYAREYRLWEGSDCDLDGELLKAKGRIALRSMAETLEEMMPRSPLVAARHSYQTGTLREFAVHWCTEDDMEILSRLPKKKKDHDGILWLLIGRSPAEEIFKGLSLREGPSMEIFGYSASLEQLRQLIIHAAASKELCALPQLQRDGVARREAVYRASQAAKELETFLENLFSPGSPGVAWYVGGEKKDVPHQRALSALLSDLCDGAFHASPRINSEMLNVDKPTSAAVAARNRVAVAMANNSLLENLGLQGCGPEVALYRSLIKAPKLHREADDGGWYLAPPCGEEEPRLGNLWNFLDALLTKADQAEELLSVSTIIQTLREAPFGMRNGPILLYLVHYLLVRSDEIALYEEGVFKPFFGDAEAMLLMRRPHLFGLRSYRINTVRSEVVRTYAQVLNTNVALLENLRNKSILSVVVPLTEFAKALPQYALRTRSLSPEALRLRNTILNAKDPQKLLFHEIPEALGMLPLSAEHPEALQNAPSFCRAFAEALEEISNAFENFSSRMASLFLEVFEKDFPQATTLKALRELLRIRGEELLPVCMDGEIKPLLSLFASERSAEDFWFSQVAALVMKKPLSSWHDSDVEPFLFRTKEYWERIRRLGVLKNAVEERQERREEGTSFTVLFPNHGLWESKSLDSLETESRVRGILKDPEGLGREERELLLSWLLEKMYLEGVSP